MWSEDQARNGLPVPRDVKRTLPASWGMSTGPKTPEGIERIRRAVTKHGRYSKAAKAEREHYRKLLQNCRELLQRT